MAYKKLHLIAIVLILMLVMGIVLFKLSGVEMKENNTAYFFAGIELQYETPLQREVLMEVLNDMLTLSESELKKKDYRDCLGNKKKVKVEEVIYSFFVPDNSKKTLNADFYQELQTKEVRQLILKLLNRLQAEKQAENI